MAQIVKKQHSLLTLSIGLDTSGAEVMVSFELHNWIDGNEVQLFSLRFPTQALGFPANGSQFAEQPYLRDDWFELPQEMLSLLRTALEPIRNKTPERPLWLQFCGAYGYLAMAPWEGALLEAAGLPILRLPCVYAPDPVECTDTLDVVICSSVPDDEVRFHAAQHVREAIASLSLASRQVTIHVFVDRTIYDHILSENWSFSNIKLYEPPDADAFLKSSAGLNAVPAVDALANPWLRWMRDEMLKSDLLADCMVFVAHGFYDSGHGAIALTATPDVKEEKSWSQFIHADEILPFLHQIGAWCCGFCAPLGNYSHAALRALMDELSHGKPGPLFYYDYYQDAGHDGISRIFEYLFSPSALARPPVSPGISLCCQPYRGMSIQELSTQNMHAGTRQNLDAMSSAWQSSSPLEVTQSVPSWLGAAERYLEAQRFQVLKAQQSAAPDSSVMNQALADALAIGGLQKLVTDIYSSTSTTAELKVDSHAEEAS